MKKLLTILVFLCLVVCKAGAEEWTDANGVTWTFYQDSSSNIEESQKLCTINGAKDYGEDIIVPETVYNGSEPYTVVGISLFAYNHFFENCTSITLPKTIKKIYNPYGMTGQGTIMINAQTPPTLDFGSHSFSDDFTFVVPAESIEAYREADGWKGNALRIISKSAKTEYSITANAQSTGSGIYQAIGEENLGNVISLTIKGTINSYDFMIMRNKMYNLHNLDLTDCSIIANSYCFYDNYCTQKDVFPENGFRDIDRLIHVKLPKTILSIGPSAFFDCDGLRTVEFQEGLETIGVSAFIGCANLQEVHLKKGLKKIGKSAFSGGVVGNTRSSYCYSLKSVSMETCEDIDDSAFRGAAISELALPKNLKRIGSGAFSGEGYSDGNPISAIVIPDGVETIESNAFSKCAELKSVVIQSCTNLGANVFSSCYALESVILPEGITVLPWGFFSGCNSLKTITLPSTIKSLAGMTFYSCSSLESIILPAHLETIKEDDFYGCSSLKSIHLPSSIRTIGNGVFGSCTSLKDYYVYTIDPTSIMPSSFSNQESAILHVPSMAYNNYYWNTEWSHFANVVEDNDYQYQYFYLTHDYVFNDAVGTMSTTPDVQLDGGSGLVVETTNTVNLNEIHMADNGTSAASIIANGNLKAETLFIELEVKANKWYFISLPFRVKASNVQAPGQYVIRYYDGQERATNGKGGWKNYTETYLQPKQGYILQCNTDGTITMTVEQGDLDFSGGDRQNALTSYVSENTQNSSWNYLGNPHSSYFDIDDTGYDAPITVWNGSSYQAVRAGDDQYHLGPLQGFFVQKPEGKAQISFPASGRHTLNQWADRVAAKTATSRSRAESQSQRQLVNLTIGDGEKIDDQTRVVFNPVKSQGYEMDCDAAKFMSDQPVAQLYSLDEQTRYAINERPQGEVNLGYVSPTKGLLTISAVRMDSPVLLRDNEMGITHDLTMGGYTFNTEAGTFESRFTLTYETTAINKVDKDTMSEKGSVYTFGGTQLPNGSQRNGAYILKNGNKVTKVLKK